MTPTSGPGDTAKEESKRWLDAGVKIGNNPTARVLCPKCQQADLNVWDQYFAGVATHVERHMKCPKCGAANSMRKARK